MCRYANVFIPERGIDTIEMPENPPGLQASSAEGIVQQDFESYFQGKDGVYLTLHDGHCLCQYDEWKAFFHFIDEIRVANQLDVVYAFVFWSDNRYEISNISIVDVELELPSDTPKEGNLFKIQLDITERLLKNIGKLTEITLKSQRTVRGILESYDVDGGYGVIRPAEGEPVYFNENEVKSVNLPD